MDGMDLQEFLNSGVFSFMLTFVRLGAVFLLMPGLGDAFVPVRVRILLALALTLVLTPVVGPEIPDPEPGPLELFGLIGYEFVIGLFIGGAARIFQATLDIAGQIISLIAGLQNAQLFNPVLGGQGSIIGGFLGVTGVALFMAANLHHLVIMGLVNSYQLFPFGVAPPINDMTYSFARLVNHAFLIGFQIASPFIVVGLMIHMVSGVIARIIPQVQAFILVLPLQILVALITLGFVTSAIFIFWIKSFESGMTYIFMGGG